jgi:hypothetical protein
MKVRLPRLRLASPPERREAIADANIGQVELPGHFAVWLASPEARFLRGKFVYANWDVEELLSRSKEIEGSPMLTLGLIS